MTTSRTLGVTPVITPLNAEESQREDVFLGDLKDEFLNSSLYYSGRSTKSNPMRFD